MSCFPCGSNDSGLEHRHMETTCILSRAPFPCPLGRSLAMLSEHVVGRRLRREPTISKDDVVAASTQNTQTAISREAFQDATLLPQLAEEHVHNFQQIMRGKRNCLPPRDITVGSACTGSASEVIALHYLEHAARSVCGYGHRMKSVFACEIKDDKRKWIQHIHERFNMASGQDRLQGAPAQPAKPHPGGASGQVSAS